MDNGKYDILDLKHSALCKDMSKSSKFMSEMTFSKQVADYGVAKSEYDYYNDRNEEYLDIPSFSKFENEINSAL